MKFADRAQYIKDLRISLIFPFIVLALVLAGIWAWRNFLDSPLMSTWSDTRSEVSMSRATTG